MYSVKEILGLVCIQYSNSLALEFVKSLTSEECEARVIGKERQRRYGIKSPKLSKALIRLGLPEKVVSQALSSTNISEVARVTADVRDLLEMGDSVHYKSCQRAGSPLRAVEELTPYLGTHLWLYVVGQRQSVDGKGFIARRLLRMMFKDQLCTKPAGVYIERAYGDQSLLPNEVLSDFFGLPVLEYSSEVKEIPLFCPSALHGYNDTLARCLAQNRYSLVECKKKSVVWVAYTGRHLTAGAYHCSLAQNRYNPQNRRFTAPALPNSWRGLVSKEERALIQVWVGLFGYPKESMKRSTYLDIVSCFSSVGKLKVTVFKEGQRMLASVVDEVLDPQYFLEIRKSKLEVVEDIEELGFYKPIDAVNGWVDGKIGESLSKQTLLNFWLDTLGFPEKGERFKQEYQCFTIIHKGQKFMVRFFANGIGLEIALEVPSDGLFPDEKTVLSHNAAKREYRVHYSLPELGFCKAVPIITYKVNDSLWVTGPLPTK